MKNNIIITTIIILCSFNAYAIRVKFINMIKVPTKNGPYILPDSCLKIALQKYNHVTGQWDFINSNNIKFNETFETKATRFGITSSYDKCPFDFKIQRTHIQSLKDNTCYTLTYGGLIRYGGEKKAFRSMTIAIEPSLLK